MACACKVNQEINKIQKYYSYNEKTRKDSGKDNQTNVKEAAYTIFVYFLLLPLVPFMFIGIILFTIFSPSKRISISKFFNFIHTVRNGKKQQIISN